MNRISVARHDRGRAVMVRTNFQIAIAATALAVAAACSGSQSTPTTPSGTTASAVRDDTSMFRLVCHRREQGPQNDLVRSFERQLS